MYIKFFSNQYGRMSADMFTDLCQACDYDPDLVLEAASCGGYVFDTNFYCDLETLVKAEKLPKMLKKQSGL